MYRQLKISDETMLVMLIAAAIFTTDFIIMAFMNLFFKINLSTFALIVMDASILVLVVSPILIIPKKKIKKEKRKSDRLNKLLEAIIEVNKLITKESNVKTMLNKSCKILCEVRNYYQVAILSCDGMPKKLAMSGSGFLGNSGETNGCIQDAIRKGEILVINNSIKECEECRYRENVPHSAVLIPFRASTEFMLLSVFSSPNHFDKEEIELLKEIAGDIGFAITKYRMEDAVYRSEKRYRLLAENVLDVIWMMDNSMNLTYVSPSVQKLLGYSAEEIISMTPERYMSLESLDLLKNTFREVMEELDKGKKISEISKTIELQMIHKNRNRIWVEVKINVIYARDSYKILGVARDITERKMAENEVRKFKTIADNASYGIAIAEPDGTLLYINNYFAEVHGYNAEELIGKNLSIFHNEEQMEEVEDINRKLVRDGSYSALEVWHTKRDGTVFPMLMSGVLIRDEAEKPQYLAATAVDITEIKKTQQKIEESERKYRTTFEHTGTAMMLIEEDTTISMVNSEFEKLSGYRKEEIEGKMSWIQFVHPEDLEKMKKYHAERRKGKNVPKKYEFRAIDKFGNTRNVLLMIDVIPGTNKSVGSLFDITSIKKLNKLLRAISEVNEVVARENNPKVVLRTVCEKLSSVYSGVFSMTHRNLEPIVSGRLSSESAKNIVGSCPSFINAFEKGVCNKMKMGSNECNRCVDMKHEFILSIPLAHLNTQYGVLAMVSDYGFDEDEISLLKRLSKNIAFALNAYDIEESRKVAVEQLVENLIQFETSADRLRNPLAVILSTIEIMDEMGVDNAINIIREHAERLRKELDEMRKEELKTYTLTKDYL